MLDETYGPFVAADRYAIADDLLTNDDAVLRCLTAPWN